MDTQEKDRTYVAQVYDSAPIVMKHSDSVYLYDDQGNRYLDCSGQYSACSLGHHHPELTQAIIDQLDTLVSVNIMFLTEERAQLAQHLVGLMPEGKWRVLMGVTGSDANELALKIAKAHTHGGAVIGFWRGFHGSTAASAAATGKTETIQENSFISQLLPGGFLHTSPPLCSDCDFGKGFPECNYQCLHYLEQVMIHEAHGHVAAVIIEPIMASAGVIIPPEGYMERLQQVVHAHNALLIYDEVVTGIGRTGTMFAFEQTRTVPDILVLGKALTGGYIPGSAVIMREKIAQSVEHLILHGHTHTAYPLMCRSALKNLEIIERENLLVQVRETGVYFLERLKELANQFSFIRDVRGKGLLLAIDIGTDGIPDYELSKRITKELLHHGLIVELECFPNLRTATLVLHPPLIFTKDHVDEVITIMKDQYRVLIS
jgi:taurine--2-oxoglutarate transaminase